MLKSPEVIKPISIKIAVISESGIQTVAESKDLAVKWDVRGLLEARIGEETEELFPTLQVGRKSQTVPFPHLAA